MFLMVRPADVEERTFQDCGEEPLHATTVTLMLPPGWRQRPLVLLIRRKVPFAPGE